MRLAILFTVMALVVMLVTPQVAVGESLTPLPVASLHRPVNVSSTTYGIILSYRPNDTSTLLATLAADGSIEPFEPSFSGSQEVYLAESNGSAGFHGGDLFLCSSDSIYRISSGAGSAALFARPSPGSTVEYIAFDQTGVWGHMLYALTGDGGLWAVNASGSSELVTSLGPNLMPEGLTVAPAGFGALGGEMLVSMENSHNVVAIARNATGTHTVLATFPDQAPERVMVVAPGQDLLVAKYDQNVIVEVPANELAGYAGLPIVITEGESGQTGAIYALIPAGRNVTVTKLFSDPSSPHFEGAAFVPQNSIALMTTTSIQVSNTTSSQATGTALASGSMFSAVVLASVFAATIILVVAVAYLWKRR